jgi:DNA-binding MarR family transcriptional regulator
MSPRVETVELAEMASRLQVCMARLGRLLRRESPAALGQSSLSTLATLVAEGPLRPGDLAAREGVRPPTMTRIISALEEYGHVARTADPADRRAFIVAVTKSGAAQVAGTTSVRASQIAEHLGQLTPAQRDAIIAALPALEALANH